MMDHCFLLLFFYFSIHQTVNCELSDLVKKFMIRAEEWTSKLQRFEQTISEQAELLANQSKAVEDLGVTVAFSASGSSAGAFEINDNATVFDDVRYSIGGGYSGITGKKKFAVLFWSHPELSTFSTCEPLSTLTPIFPLLMRQSTFFHAFSEIIS